LGFRIIDKCQKTIDTKILRSVLWFDFHDISLMFWS
jgi:hypothetical protein